MPRTPSANHGNHWRHNRRIRAHMERTLDLVQRGLPYSVVADQLHVTRRTVLRNLDRLHQLWLDDRRALADAQRLRSLGAVREATREAWNQIARTPTNGEPPDPRTIAALLRVVVTAQREARYLTQAIAGPGGAKTNTGPSGAPPPEDEDLTLRDVVAQFTTEELEETTQRYLDDPTAVEPPVERIPPPRPRPTAML